MFEFYIPLHSAEEPELHLSLDPGEILFLIGANGTGKSSLMHSFYTKYIETAKRITAHRQTWLHSNLSEFTAAQKLSTERSIKSQDRQLVSRYKDVYSHNRPNIAIYDLIEAENTRAREIAKAVDINDIGLAKKLSENTSPTKLINQLFNLSNLSIDISIHENEQVMARRKGSGEYSATELSDGERNALLIAINILTAKEQTLILVDEPERHLHRSIISPFLTNLFQFRGDCSFIVSTHDVSLPIDNPSAQVLLIRECIYENSQPKNWNIDLIPNANDIDEALKKDILGSRRKLLFIEGEETSLDFSLYSTIFPDVTVIPKGSCKEVQNAVLALKSSTKLHWLEVYGLIDKDNREEADIDLLQEKGVYALPVYSVESLYYHPNIQSRVAKSHTEVIGGDSKTLVERAQQQALTAIKSSASSLSVKAATQSIRKYFLDHIPKVQTVRDRNSVNISIDTQEYIDVELERLNSLITSENLLGIMRCYPIRETPALDKIAKGLGFTSRSQYESAVIQLLRNDEDTRRFIGDLFGNLYEKLTLNESKHTA